MYEVNKKKSNKSIIVGIIILVLILVGVGGYFYLNRNTSSNKKTFINSVNGLFKRVNNVKEYDTITTTFDVSVDIKSSLYEKEMLDIINSLNINGKSMIDLKNGKSLVDFKLRSSLDELFAMTTYSLNNNIYIYLNNIYDKWIKSEVEENFDVSVNLLEQDTSFEDTIKVLSQLKNVIFDSIDEKYFSLENDSDSSTVTLTIDKDNILDIVKSIIENVKTDKELNKLFKDNFGIDVVTVLDENKEKIDELTNDTFKDFETVKLSITTNTYNDNKNFALSFNIDDQPYRIELNIDGENSSSIDIYTAGIKFMSLSVNNTVNNDINNTTIKFNMFTVGTVTLKINYKNVYNEKIDDVDVSNNISSADLSEEDINEIMMKIFSNEKLLPLLTGLTIDDENEI